MIESWVSFHPRISCKIWRLLTHEVSHKLTAIIRMIGTLSFKTLRSLTRVLSDQPKPVMARPKQISARKTREASERSSDHFKTHKPTAAKPMPIRVVRGLENTRSDRFFMVVGGLRLNSSVVFPSAGRTAIDAHATDVTARNRIGKNAPIALHKTPDSG